MANEVIANAERVVKLAWEGVQVLEKLMGEYKGMPPRNSEYVDDWISSKVEAQSNLQKLANRPSWLQFGRSRLEAEISLCNSHIRSLEFQDIGFDGFLEAAISKRDSLERIRFRALASASMITLQEYEATTVGTIAARVFEPKWRARFEREYGAAKE